MLSLKNPFARPTTIPAPAEFLMPEANEANKAVKRWQLEQGRTRKRVEQLRDQLQLARVDLAQSEQTLGERMAEGLDSTTATEAMTRAVDHVRALEVALSVATDKDEAAHAALKQAELQVSIEAETAACAVVLALGPRWEEILAAVRQIAIDTALAADGMRVAGGNEKYAYGVNEITAQARLFMGLAMHPLTNNGHVPTAFMKYKTLTECLDAVCGRHHP